MIRKSIAAGLKAGVVALSLLSAASAFAAPASDRVEGKVVSLTGDQLTLVGVASPITLQPGVKVLLSTPIQASAIQPGSYLGTTNLAKPDGTTGVSIEVHVSPPGIRGPGVDYVMDANAGTMMTNGVVDQVVQSDGGRVLTVNHGKGVRVITVPPSAKVLLNSPSDLAHIMPGEMVHVATFTLPNGVKSQYVIIDAP